MTFPGEPASRRGSPLTVLAGALLGAATGWVAGVLLSLRLEARLPGFHAWADRLLAGAVVAGALTGAWLGFRRLRTGRRDAATRHARSRTPP